MPRKGKKKNAQKVPFVDLNLTGRYYNDSHRQFSQQCKVFCQKNLEKNIVRESLNGYDFQNLAKYYDIGKIWACPPPEFNKKALVEFEKYGGILPENCDYFHLLIWILQTGTYGGITSGVLYVTSLSLASIFRHGSPRLKSIVAPEVISGRALMAIVISEPGGGSDVAGIKLKAELDGNDWVLNGEKYYITNGLTAKYLTVACRTGAPGVKGLSFIMVPRNTEGIFGSRMNIQSGKGNDTAYLTFKDVRVPKDNLIGVKNLGFYYIMESFNHERFGVAAQQLCSSRICIREAIQFGRERKTFGKRLIDHQVIRHKVVNMARQYMRSLAWCEQICEKFVMGVAMKDMGAECALLKVDCCRTAEHCAREARQVFGGRGVIQGGRGARIELISRQVGAATVYAGSEEILVDLAGRISKL